MSRALEHLTIAENSSRNLAEYLKALQQAIALASLQSEQNSLISIKEQLERGVVQDFMRSANDSIEAAIKALMIQIDKKVLSFPK